MKTMNLKIITVAVDGIENVLYPDLNAPKLYKGASDKGVYSRYVGVHVPSDPTLAPAELTLTFL